MNSSNYYKTKITKGCISADFEVDGYSWNSDNSTYEFKDKQKFVIDLGAHITKLMLDNEISAQSVLELVDYDERESEEHPCEQCGDYSSWEIRKIPRT